ncbi:hypothetical protein F5887DRAFT_1161813 [Amanita rubescens]|nr:hypothetical protein F5887DRAFT_1161813 [Amanita rubescens]
MIRQLEQQRDDTSTTESSGTCNASATKKAPLTTTAQTIHETYYLTYSKKRGPYDSLRVDTDVGRKEKGNDPMTTQRPEDVQDIASWWKCHHCRGESDHAATRCAIRHDIMLAIHLQPFVVSLQIMLRFPIVIVHGLGDFNHVTGCLPARNVEAMLRLRKIKHLMVTLVAFGSVQERTSSLAQQIQAAYPDQLDHIIAQSMGTPHHGIRSLDFSTVSRCLDILARVLGQGGMKDLSESAMTKFNNRTPNDPSVQHYFSWAAQLHPHQLLPPIFWSSQRRVAAADSRPSDGLVTVESATRGTHLGMITGEDKC